MCGLLDHGLSAWSHLGPFSVADGRPKVIVELGVVTAFVVLAAMAITERQRPIDAAEIGGIVGEWLTHTPDDVCP